MISTLNFRFASFEVFFRFAGSRYSFIRTRHFGECGNVMMSDDVDVGVTSEDSASAVWTAEISFLRVSEAQKGAFLFTGVNLWRP